jgi:hypothetical protein
MDIDHEHVYEYKHSKGKTMKLFITNLVCLKSLLELDNKFLTVLQQEI